ncbi:hypothetical protein F5Y18DRAFT_415265 [Xylariaceae sp. FL1019]|nr:hypothetical protein F5Y18DRAFT_415265 [Xylariaceae sp. FL1019]
MNSFHIAGSPAPSPARGRGRGRGGMRGRGGIRKMARKNGVPSTRGGGGPRGRGRNKRFEDPRTQAAHDRQHMLRDLFSEVASAMKPALDHLADLNIKLMTDNPVAHREVHEYEELQRQLDQRRDEAMRRADREFNTRTAVATREYQLHTQVTENKFLNSYDYATEDFLDASRRRASILAELRNEGVGTDIPDTTFTYAQRPNSVAHDQGVHVVFRNGIKIPYPNLQEDIKKAAAVKAQVGKIKPSIKRKADDQPDGLPEPKKSATRSGLLRQDEDDGSTPQPRHIKGLLSAEIEPDGEPESNAASPSPESDPRVEGVRGKKDLPDLPNGASEPDRWGVRTVNRRGPKANNRLILPPFMFDDEDIGFRDSTNDSTRKATRGTRGRFLNSANSRNLHVDRTITTYDCLEHRDDDLDSALILKHRLHPKYGLVLPDSINEPESPKVPVSGSNPVVVITPDGTTLHASRSVRAYNMDAALEQDAKKDKVDCLIAAYCAVKNISPEEIATAEILERNRKRQALRRSSSIHETKEDGSVGEESGVQDKEQTDIAQGAISALLNAAEHLESERPLHAQSSQRASRPYDAVRDVFTSTDPVPSPAIPLLEIDTQQLSHLADVAETVSRNDEPQVDPRLSHHYVGRGYVNDHSEHLHLHQPIHHHEHRENRPDRQTEHQIGHQHAYRTVYPVDSRMDEQAEHRYEPTETRSMGDSMIDPRLLGHSNQAPTPQHFLHTALIATPTLANIAPAPAQAQELSPRNSISKNPFTAHTGNKGSPVLPPLRPPRREKATEPLHPSPLPLLHMQQHSEFGPSMSMIQSNAGNFYPPAPSRSYHQGHTTAEPTHIGFPSQPPMPGSGIDPASSQFPGHLPPPGQSYQPPSPTLSHHAQQLASHMPQGSSVSPPGSVMGPNSPTGHPGSRHRASMSSGSNGPNSRKYRSIAAAPIPHNRPWPGSNGTELRLAHYDHKEAIKDYSANEPPPRTGPTLIRGWTNVNNVSKGKKGLKKEDSEDKDSPSNITPYINKWNPSDRNTG